MQTARIGWPERIARGQRSLQTLWDARVLRPGFVLPLARAALEHGQSLATGIAASAIARPRDAAVIDDAGRLTFRELLRRVMSIANALRQYGVGPDHNVAILARNHRGFVESTAAVSRLGADALFLNTGFAAPQLRDVLDRERAQTLVYDQEFEEIVAKGAGDRVRVVAWHDGSCRHPTLDDWAEEYAPDALPKPTRLGGATILTSGTTGTPKGANRDTSSSDSDSALGVLEVMPLRARVTTLVAAPAFHAWGLLHTLTGMLLSCTLVLHRRFDPERVLADVEAHRVDTLVLVPVMLQRILALPAETRRRYDTRSLRLVLASGSALPGELALRWMDSFGDNLYNFYGSTEVAQASIATPRDLRAAPGTAGRPPRGTEVRILDDAGRPVPVGTTGRIFVRNKAQFTGYTGGGGKQMIDGLMSIGDVGHFDAQGRLFVEGRDDDMIVSGGENVFPSEVEDLLADQPEVLEAAVIGVPDEEFGQRLRAFVVLREGADLDQQAVQELVRSNLARHKVPRDVVFLDEIPRNPTGKVLKRVLREHA